MSNQYFRFKQFTIQQDRCAMKVSTDACIQGAWTPLLPGVRHVLDIGAGTGLLSLMLVQRDTAIKIDGIEIDVDAAKQVKENVASSPWAESINVIQGDATAYDFPLRYDMVICNPPFFQNSLLGDRNKRNIARHTLSLTYQGLIDILKKSLRPDGYASVLLPFAEHAQWEILLQQNGWNVFKRLVVRPKDTLEPNRVVSLCAINKPKQPDEQLTIYTGEQMYTKEFVALLQPYYLNL